MTEKRFYEPFLKKIRRFFRRFDGSFGIIITPVENRRLLIPVAVGAVIVLMVLLIMPKKRRKA